MPGRVMDVRDVINGKEGTATVVFDDGRVVELFMCKNIKAEYEKIKKEIKSVGRRGTQHKTVGWKGTGTMTLHTMMPDFKEMCMEYASTGTDFYFDITIINNDPASTAGGQTVVLQNCNIDKVTLGEINSEDETLVDEIPFTYGDVNIVSAYKIPTR